MSVLIIGISGVTCGGKTTATSELLKLFSNSKVFYQDNYFFDQNDPRHVWCEEVNHINYDILTSMDMEKMYKDIVEAIENRKVSNRSNRKRAINNRNDSNVNDTDINICQNISELLKKHNVQLFFVDGFLLFNYKPFLSLISMKYFFTLAKDECKKRRDKRVYDPPDIPGYFENCVWPEYIRHLEEIKNYVGDITYLESETQETINIILHDIYEYLKINYI
ncbi:hypothetical protein HHI36_017025 [Cryptolaemus montrouzieri]|uniref:Nicotinamide riboside kinase 1 n=1 Tax=Cryptolaemus montrouzieri TaxID=559131 RepID=A0ABD2NLC6_9CUCU